ncbi:hypothetical protein MTsPCn9_12640 [Croceitalea sp. MTPC9]|uniref:hypothetical protein n=1 Tax=unclassified Croceitalea TaxID=2632280 RepID=UPI002B3A31C7|nr:hypothetical protein MTsPCn6_16490 [Croceitalea sp. MTPC6]GMN16328.1 hypothetical protein MTsPCn9_12640 [Croceitalea sp. MTPC9]
MKPLALLLSCILLASCGSTKSTVNTAKSEENKLILPPDVPSNKYSKTRQAKRN